MNSEPLELRGYETLTLVGSGGLGDVYRATRTSTGGEVAIKMVREHGDRAATDRRVRRELQALLKLKGHPNVVQIEELLDVSTGLALVMEYVGGGSLADLVERRGPLHPPHAVAALADIARALADAHAIGIVHRDIKPHNVMVGQFGQCKVCDFGIAAVLKDSSFTDRTSALSYRYASPEELDDSPEIGAPTDVYSLGVTFRQLLTGETNEARYRSVLEQREIEQQWDDIERVVLAQLDALIAAMTARDSASRPTATQVLDSVRVLEGRLGPNRVASVIADRADTAPRTATPPAAAPAAPPAAPDVLDDATVVRPRSAVPPLPAAPGQPAPAPPPATGPAPEPIPTPRPAAAPE
ncbi:MAG: serine/threonine-protein kinase, partial [Ilumatobacteraceae bacterium]